MQRLPRAGALRHPGRDDNVLPGSGRILRHDVPRSDSERPDARPDIPPSSQLVGGRADGLFDHRGQHGGSWFHDSVRRLLGYRGHQDQGLPSLENPSWRTHLMRSGKNNTEAYIYGLCEFNRLNGSMTGI